MIEIPEWQQAIVALVYMKLRRIEKGECVDDHARELELLFKALQRGS